MELSRLERKVCRWKGNHMKTTNSLTSFFTAVIIPIKVGSRATVVFSTDQVPKAICVKVAVAFTLATLGA